MRIELPEYVKEVLTTLNNSNFTAYVVGGCVRDSLLGLEPKDWDVTTDATPNQVEDIFDHTIPTGKQYGTITVICKNSEQVEVTSFRADGNYSDGRRPDKVTFGKDIIEDLSRRDLTINAMAYNELVGLVDPFNGQQDLENKIIKFVGNPGARIREDALRILRAVRFMLRLNFSMDDETAKELNSLYKLLDNLSKERIHDELIQILNYLKNDNYKDFITDKGFNLFKYIFEVKYLGPVLQYLFEDIPYTLKLAYILKCKKLYETEMWLRKYKFSNDNIKEIISLMNIDTLIAHTNKEDIDFNSDVILKNLLRHFEESYVTEYFTYYENGKLILDINHCLAEPYRIKHLKLSGDNLVEKGLKGKQIRECLEYLLDYVITDSNLNNEEDLYNIVDTFILYKNKKTLKDA